MSGSCGACDLADVYQASNAFPEYLQQRLASLGVSHVSVWQHVQNQAKTHLAATVGRAALRWKSATSSTTSGSMCSQPNSLAPMIGARSAVDYCPD